MRGKTCIVTGANSGIGLETARGLAQRGATVVMICRDATRGENARQELIASTGNDAIHLLLANLASLESIREVADAFLTGHDRLDVLINNAGVYRAHRSETVDGYETTFAVNHLAYFLLTHLLLDRLKAGAPARVVNVSSDAHRLGKINFDDLHAVSRYNGYTAYAQSKLANILFTSELARRVDSSLVTTYALHPGVVATNIANHGPGFFNFFFKVFKPFFLNARKGAETSLYLATAQGIESKTGRYFEKDKVVKPAAAARNLETAKRLWEISEKLTGIA